MYVYLLKNTINGKKYVGMTSKDVNTRFLQHCRAAKANPKTLLHRSIRKYGVEAWQVSILEKDFQRIEDLCDAEIRYIRSINPELNMARGGMGGDNSNCENFKKYIALRDYSGDKHPMFNRQQSDDTRNKISKSKKGIPLRADHRRKVTEKLCSYKLSNEDIEKRVESVAKTYEITDPSGRVFMVKNLTKFCKQYNLNQGNMNNVALGRYKSSKGYKVKLVS